MITWSKNNISDLLRELIHALQVKDAEFAQVCGIKKATLSSYINGKSAPGWQTLRNIVLSYDVNPAWLLTGEGLMFLDGSRDKPDELPQEEISDKLTPEQRNMLTYKRLQTELGTSKERIADGIDAIVMGKRHGARKHSKESGFGEDVGFSERGGDGVGVKYLTILLTQQAVKNYV
ncbi:helix-turn-helix domain-containing protein [Solidesulfovibrio sp.]